MRPVTTYAAALAALATAVLLRVAIDPWLGDHVPFALALGAVAAAVWVGGSTAAIVVAILGYVTSDLLFVPPRGVLHFRDAPHVVGFLTYLFTAGVIIVFGAGMRAAQARARQQREIFRITLASIGDGVITTDVAGRVTYLNAVAESLTGWRNEEARGEPLDRVFRIVSETTREPVENPARRALSQGMVVGLTNHTILIKQNGDEISIDDSAAPIRDEYGRVSGCVLIFRDVTLARGLERERARQLVTARTLASIVESSDDAIISKALDGTIQSWNSAAERIFGYSAEQAIGRHIALVIPPERLAEEDHIIASLRAGRRIDHFETERVRRDGERILVSLTISPIHDESGNVIGASKIVRDVTVQRRADDRARELLAEAARANAKFRAFFDQGAVFAGILHLDGTVVEANQLSWEGCGFTKEQVLGKPFWHGPWWAPSPDLVARIEAGAAEAAAGAPFRAEMPYFVADGSQRIVEISIQPIKDDEGRVIFLAPMGTDITERKRTEADRERLATLVENSTDFIGICDLDGMPVYVNRAGLALAGLDDVEQARRTPVAEFFFPEDRARIMNDFFAVVRERGHAEIEVRFRHFKTGAPRWMTYKVLALRDAAGRPTAFATVSQDITERKRMEDDLRMLAAHLSEADRRKDEFLATLAHELRNPLAPIRNMLEVMKHADGDREVVERARATMERQLGQMVRLVDDLLDLNRISHDRLELRLTSWDVATAIEHAVEVSRPLVDAAGHDLRVTVPPEPLPLHADGARLTQVFANLINNSCKYTPPGGTIRVGARRDGDDVVVTVEDDGLGIPADKLDRIFDMFMQIDDSVPRSQGGLGIGLTLVKRLVEMHGGKISVRSDGAGRGSQFTVRLPIGLEPLAVSVPEPAEVPAARSRRIVVVDDNSDSAISLAMLLEINGNETHTAHDGLEAIATIEQHRPEIVLLDIGLPKLSGHDVCRRLREQPWGKEMAIIALTGWGQDDDRRKSKEAGFDGHLVKPVDYGALMALLDTLTPGSASG